MQPTNAFLLFGYGRAAKNNPWQIALSSGEPGLLVVVVDTEIGPDVLVVLDEGVDTEIGPDVVVVLDEGVDGGNGVVGTEIGSDVLVVLGELVDETEITSVVVVVGAAVVFAALVVVVDVPCVVCE